MGRKARKKLKEKLADDERRAKEIAERKKELWVNFLHAKLEGEKMYWIYMLSSKVGYVRPSDKAWEKHDIDLLLRNAREFEMKYNIIYVSLGDVVLTKSQAEDLAMIINEKHPEYVV